MNKNLLQINVQANDTNMREAFDDGLEHYQPVLLGKILKEEGGITQVSLDNINEIAKTCGKIVSFEAGLNMNVLCRFENGTEYLATGFGWGYGGTGPSALARLAAEMGLGDVDLNRRRLGCMKSEYVGMLFE